MNSLTSTVDTSSAYCSLSKGPELCLYGALSMEVWVHVSCQHDTAVQDSEQGSGGVTHEKTC